MTSGWALPQAHEQLALGISVALTRGFLRSETLKDGFSSPSDVQRGVDKALCECAGRTTVVALCNIQHINVYVVDLGRECGVRDLMMK